MKLTRYRVFTVVGVLHVFAYLSYRVSIVRFVLARRLRCMRVRSMELMDWGMNTCPEAPWKRNLNFEHREVVSNFSACFENSSSLRLRSRLDDTHVALMDLVSLLRSCEFDLTIFMYLFLNSTPACSSCASILWNERIWWSISVNGVENNMEKLIKLFYSMRQSVIDTSKQMILINFSPAASSRLNLRHACWTWFPDC